MVRAAWNQVDVGVEDGLSRSLATVHSNIKTVDLAVRLAKGLFTAVQQLIDSVELSPRHGEVILCVTLRNDQHVSLGDGKGVLYCVSEFVLFYDP